MPLPKKSKQILTKQCKSLAEEITVLTHISDDICNGGFGASTGFDIWGSFCFDMSTVDAAPEKLVATVGTANPWFAALADVLGVGTVLVLSIGVNPEVGESDFFFSGPSLLPNGGCDMPATPSALVGILGTSARGKLGAGLGSPCCRAKG
jgi:hypothetical protein